MKMLVQDRHKRSGGFTLVELLVSIGILVLFSAVIIPSFSRIGRRNELHQGAQYVQSKILQTKAYALAPRSIADPNLEVVRYWFQGPAIHPGHPCGSGANLASIDELSLGDDPDEPLKFGTIVECIELPANIIFTSPSDQRLVFNVVQQGAIYFKGVPPLAFTYTVKHTRLTEKACRDIVITVATGLTRIDPPRDC